MGELIPFKEGINGAAIDAIADNISRVFPSFDTTTFRARALDGLRPLELKARVLHVAQGLRVCLPPHFEEAANILIASAQDWQKPAAPKNLQGFAAWPVVEFVGLFGHEHFDAGMQALRALTHLASAEFAIRRFIEADEARALDYLHAWTNDASHHVRRLVSEGTRPRLPWGGRLRSFQKNPQPVLELLEKLRDDETDYVCRSVANNLNDIGKDHQTLLVDVCKRWRKGASPQRLWIVKHALRSLVKQGDAKALAILGYDSKARFEVSHFKVAPKRVVLGEGIMISFSLQHDLNHGVPVVIDYVVHHRKKRGDLTPKVFKLKTLELGVGDVIQVSKRHVFKPITTRRYYPGKHRVEILLNGQPSAVGDFVLEC